MGYLLDTDIIIDFFNNQKEAVNLFRKIINRSLKISIITFIEFEYGLMKSSFFEKKEEKFIQFLNDFAIEIIPLEEKIAREFLRLKISLEKQKTPLADFDLLIAGTALSHNLTLITGNKKHFSRIKNLSFF